MKSTKLCIALLSLLTVACAEERARSRTAQGSAGDGPIRFKEVGAASGLVFRHVSGEDGRFLLPAIMGGGAGFLDYDSDGWLDVFLVHPSSSRLFRNDGQGRFTDVTVEAKLSHTGYGMGCAAGDYDNDGDVDLYVTNLGPNALYRNEGDGTFSDATSEAGVAMSGWSTSAAFVDHDADGDLDLFVARYVDWVEGPGFTDRECLAVTGARDYCSPQAYAAPSYAVLFRNEGDGRFTDVSEASGLHARKGTGLGVVCTDLDGDGRTDLYVANDQMPSFAWIQLPDGRFAERAASLGVAVSETGKSQAGMGVAVADVDADGDFDLWKVHLYREGHVLYVREQGFYDDATTRLGLAAPTRPFTGFGTGWHDFDLDGALDVFIANGRVQVVPVPTGAEDPYAERNQILRRIASGRFADVTAAAGPDLEQVETSRAAAFGDYDNDGDVDVLVANRDGAARLYRNDSSRQGAFLSLRILDEHGRDAIGASVRATAGDIERVREVTAAYSYLATHDPRVHFGLGPTGTTVEVEVRWPGGRLESFGPFEANHFVELRPGNSVAATEMLPKSHSPL